MPPKSQKMGSITHNSAEVNNRGGSRGGMLSKLKGSFTTGGSKATSSKASVASKDKSKNGGGERGASSTVHSHPSANSKLNRRVSSSFTHGTHAESAAMLSHDFKQVIDENEAHLQHQSGIPTSITALVDAASCLSDDMTQHMLGLAEPPSRQNMRGSLLTYGSSDVAGRALANMHISGTSGQGGERLPQESGGGMPRNNSAEWARGQGGGGNHNNMVQANNGGYTNYQMEGYEDEEADYYDESGGGIFDDAYMQSSRISVSAHQPPPPDRGYNRRTSNAEDYAPQDSRAKYSRRATADQRPEDSRNMLYNNRRPSAEEYMPESAYYHGQPDYGVPANTPEYADDAYGSGGHNGHNTHYHEGDNYNNPTERYMTKSMPPNNVEPKRNSIDNSGCGGPRRRTTMDYDPRKAKEGRHASMGHGPMPENRPPCSINMVVNNTGRPGPDTSNAVESRTRSPKPGLARQASQRISSQQQKNNPTWFDESNNNSSNAEQHLRSSANSRESKNSLRRSRNHNDYDDDDRTMATMATKDQALRPSAMNRAKDMTSPTGDVTIVYTDVQGSTSMWESCPSDMKKATDVHDTIMRQCYTNHSGYEINTEGDSFNLAFQHPVDALAFALQAQIKLYKADWPDGILKHPDGKEDPSLKFRGFRVRFGIHHGPTTSRVHEMTGRMVYSGEGVKISKAVEGMCHGGQILTTMETWKAVSGMAERYLGRPQILDCGEHLLFETKNQNSKSNGYTTTRYTRRIMQLVPSDLAFDFFEARGRRDVPSEDGKMGFEIKDAAAVNGRLFPPLTSKRQLTTCFLNAPYANGRVTICFVYTVGLDDNPDNRATNLAVLAKYLRKQLLLLNPPGYECQEDNGCWMLAFDRMAHAVTFGLQLKSTLQGAEDLVGSVDRENMFKVGILSGPFTSMGPHKTTGMADYFGPIVNRAARVASNCDPGQVCVGIPLSNGVTADPPDFGPTVNVSLQGIKKLKGITIDVAIFACSKRRIETLY